MPERGVVDLLQPPADGIGADTPDRFAADTRDLPPAIRFDAWRAFWQPAVEVRAPRGGAGGFVGHAMLRWLGHHILMEVDAQPASYRRARRQSLRDGFDHWPVALRYGPDAGAEEPQAIWLGSLAHGFGLRDIGGPLSGVLIQPERLPQLAPIFVAPRVLPVHCPSARMLAGMLPRIAASADEAGAGDMPRLEAAMSSMIAACLLGLEMQPTSTRLQLEAARRARVIALADAELGDPDLSPATLVVRSGLSRSELYRCFAPVGGIARAIQLRRLRRAYAELARADGPASVSRVGGAVGFFDPSSFTRAFRREFGCTPSEVLVRRPAMTAPPLPGFAAALSFR